MKKLCKRPFIVAIDGLDGTGKQCESELLVEKLNSLGKKAIRIDFPQYDRWHSILVRLYLDGKFSNDPKKVSPYITSLFFALDRFFAFHTFINRKYKDYDYIVFDRYVESNMILQGCKAFDGIPSLYNPKSKFNKTIRYIEKLEYGIFRLPKPDIVIILNITVDQVIKNLKSRGNKPDIHETEDYQRCAYHVLQHLISMKKWKSVSCMNMELNNMKSISEIHDKIMSLIQ